MLFAWLWKLSHPAREDDHARHRTSRRRQFLAHPADRAWQRDQIRSDPLDLAGTDCPRQAHALRRGARQRKSALAASITATVTTGGAYPCREGRAPQGSVLLVCPDGDPDVLIPRLKAAGADLGRVQLMRCKAQKDCGGLISRLTCPRSPKRRGRSRT